MNGTLDKMNELLGDKLSGKGIYTQKQEPTILIIEDLAPLGYRMADRHSGLDIEHCLLAIRGLAKFHASSVKLFENVRKIFGIIFFLSLHFCSILFICFTLLFSLQLVV